MYNFCLFCAWLENLSEKMEKNKYHNEFSTLSFVFSLEAPYSLVVKWVVMFFREGYKIILGQNRILYCGELSKSAKIVL